MWVLAALNYGTFFALAIVNIRLWRFIRARTLCTTAKLEGSKHLMISIVFSLSYLYKGIYNTLLASMHEKMLDFMNDNTLWW